MAEKKTSNNNANSDTAESNGKSNSDGSKRRSLQEFVTGYQEKVDKEEIDQTPVEDVRKEIGPQYGYGDEPLTREQERSLGTGGPGSKPLVNPAPAPGEDRPPRPGPNWYWGNNRWVFRRPRRSGTSRPSSSTSSTSSTPPTGVIDKSTAGNGVGRDAEGNLELQGFNNARDFAFLFETTGNERRQKIEDTGFSEEQLYEALNQVLSRSENQTDTSTDVTQTGHNCRCA